MKVVEEKARLEKGGIVSESSFEKLGAVLRGGDIVVLHGVFSADLCAALIDGTLAWEKTVAAFDHEKSTREPARDENFHRIDLNPAKSKTPHIFHAHNFNNIGALDAKLRESLMAVFTPMVGLQNGVAGTAARICDFSAAHTLHPQVIHYPRGGGYFGRHEHPLEPQRVGLIAGLSARGTAFKTGSTLYFPSENGREKTIDMDQHQTLGSITMFRYDIPHAVTAVDEDADMSFSTPDGRWVAILPYY
jgi:hypothetical protein